jgi:hypothetical protein
MLIISILFTLVGELSSLSILGLISYIPLGICIYRVFSKDVSKRQMENYKFSMLMSPVYSWLKKKQNHALNAKTHRYFKCPNCKSDLRVPKGKGKIIITCPKCKTEFREKT